MGSVLSALPQLTPLGEAAGPGAGAPLWTLAVAGGAWAAVCLGLLLRSAHGVASIPRGFVPEGIVVAQLHTAGYSDAERHVFYRRLLDALRDGGPVSAPTRRS